MDHYFDQKSADAELQIDKYYTQDNVRTHWLNRDRNRKQQNTTTTYKLLSWKFCA